jgi:hypothetical protein
MPIFKVMCFRGGAWDGLGDAAARVCGEPVVVGPDQKSPVYLKVWPLLPAAEWFHVAPKFGSETDGAQ